MPKPEVEEFAKLLLTCVRDEAISSCDRLLRPAARSVIALRWHNKMATAGCEEFVREIIPDCVDEAIFFLLHAVDEGLLRLSFAASNGTTVDLMADGESEMAGWFASGDWKKAYSEERFNDDLSDLGSIEK
ncbi:MAG TPA: hypothetical protein VHY91_08045 [Pirellulales bacterium]|jgi:hypothetical protein|nr:hypothetical protein [Pirellulales bacterium]